MDLTLNSMNKNFILLGTVRVNELSESIEDHTKRQTMFFSSYKQLLDFVDDCKDTLW